jgi:hypothetical protein
MSASLRIAGIDDWCWQKGETYGTIIVDLERRTVADVLPVRSATSTQHWLERQQGIEIVSRDRCGLYAQAARQGAPQDRFHLQQNLKACCPGPMPCGRRLLRPAARRACQISAYNRNGDCGDQGQDRCWSAYADQMDRLPRLAGPASRQATARSPAYFRDFLEQQWAAENRHGRHLLHDLRNRGYTGSHSHLARFLAEWRYSDHPTGAKNEARTTLTLLVEESKAIDPVSGWHISPQVAAALCLAPTDTLTPHQDLKVAALKQSSPSFVVMRRLAIRFRGLFRSGKAEKLDA